MNGMDQVQQQTASGRNARRSKNGCWTCRTKKVKCDEVRPKCGRCIRLKLLCDYAPRMRHNDMLVISQDLMAVLETAATMPAWAQRAALTRALALPVQLPELPSSACSLDLTSADHESIRYFRTTFARIHHTKNPDYSLFSIIFNIAEREPMVMRVLLALGGQEIEFRRNSDADTASVQLAGAGAGDRGGPRWTPLQHYSAALRLLADAISSGDDGRQLDLDTVCATLYLMLVYEQKYGDSTCSGLSNHLAGAALIVKHRCHNLRLQITSQDRQKTPCLVRRSQSAGEQQSRDVLLLLTRLLVWIALCDLAAATFGLGGQFNSELTDILGQNDSSPLPGFDNLHRFSNALYRTMWGDTYPQAELLDDVENRDVFAFFCGCMQLRFMVAELGKLDTHELPQRISAICSAFRLFDQRHGELLEVAAELSTATDNSHRLVANIRACVPTYHAVKLELLRFTRSAGATASMDIAPAAHARAILDLAFQAYKHQGSEAMIRIAWALFVTALETDSPLHRSWIVSRFKEMSRYGENLMRAHRFLVEALQMQACLGQKIDVQKHVHSGHAELFVL